MNELHSVFYMYNDEVDHFHLITQLVSWSLF